MTQRTTAEAKRAQLKAQGTLHPHPERVSDPLFLAHEFFDPHDLVQVKYEMLRRVQREGQHVGDAAAAFGFSRVAFYQAQDAFAQQGLAGLIPARRGPRGAHKLSDPVIECLLQAVAEDPSLRPPALAALVEARFGVTIHPRSIERAFVRRQKKR